MTEMFRANANAIGDPYGDAAFVYRRNPVVNAMKTVLGSSRAALPEPVYESLYAFSFGFYKALLRGMYFRHVARHWLARDGAALSRARAVHQVMPYSLVGSAGLEATFDAASSLVERGVPGDFIECGVAQGGCAALMAGVAAASPTPRNTWLFDSLEGLPDPTEADYDEQRKSTGKHIRPLVRGSCCGTKNQVEALLFSRFGFARDSIFLMQGWFQDTLPLCKEQIGQIALLRVDGDWYESTMCCLDNLYDQVAPGGSIIIDDYGVCFGCKRAVHGFFAKRDIRPHLIPDNRGGVRFSKGS